MRLLILSDLHLEFHKDGGAEVLNGLPPAEGPVAFLHPRAGRGVMVELIEAPGGPAWAALGYPQG